MISIKTILNIDIDYIKSIFYVLCATAIYMFGDIMLRRFGAYGIDMSLFNFIKASLQSCIIIILAFFLNNRSVSSVYKALRTDYFVFYLLKSVMFVTGAILWSVGATANDASLPMYLISYVTFITPIMLRLLSCLLLNASWAKHFDVICICTIAYIPIITYIYDAFFRYELIIMMGSYIAYTVVDFMNELSVAKRTNGLLSVIASKFSEYNDSFIACIFNNVLACACTFGLHTLYKFGFSNQWAQELHKISSMPLPDLSFYIISSALSMTALYCMCKAFALKGAASAQIINTFQPIIFGTLFGLTVLLEVKVGSFIFLIGAIYAIYIDSRANADEACEINERDKELVDVSH